MLAACAATPATPPIACADQPPAPRDYAGRIIRNPAARADFRKLHPCPETGLTAGACPGWVVDHIVALKRGGPDHPCNMQWQSTSEALEKDRFE